MSKSVSVVLPVFNGERWLKDAIESTCRQTWPVAEVVVIDDGSTDKSAEIANSLSRKFSCIRVLQNERNLGIVASLNRGVEFAKGTYIARMDADDICYPTRIARQLAFLEETDSDFCGSWFVEFGGGPPRVARWPSSETAVRTAMVFQNAFCHPTILAHRSVFEQFQYREEFAPAEDYDLFGRALSRFRGSNVPTPLLRYRRHPAQATQARRDAMEIVTRRIRTDQIAAHGIAATIEDLRVHNLIRAPKSIRNIDDLESIAAWLERLLGFFPAPESKRVIRSQWVRACIRAAPLGPAMLRAYRSSPLAARGRASLPIALDLIVLALLRLSYESKPFSLLRRAGVSA